MSKNRLSFTPDSRLAAVDMGGAVLLVDVARRMPLAVYSTGSSGSGGALSLDGHLIAASGGGSVITLTETRAHNDVQVPFEAMRVAVQPDGERITTISHTGEVAVHSLGEPERLIVMPSADDEFYWRRVEDLSPDGLRYAVAGDPTNQIRLLDISSSPAPEVPLEGTVVSRSTILMAGVQLPSLGAER